MSWFDNYWMQELGPQFPQRAEGEREEEEVRMHDILPPRPTYTRKSGNVLLDDPFRQPATFFDEGGDKSSQASHGNGNTFLHSPDGSTVTVAVIPNGQGIYQVPWYEDTPLFKDHNPDEKVPDNLLAQAYRNKGLNYGDAYAMWHWQTKDNLERQGYKTKDYTPDEKRRAIGLRPMGDTGDLRNFAKPLMAAEALPIASALAGTGAASAVGSTLLDAAKWGIPNIGLPVLGGQAWDETNRMYNGKSHAENISEYLQTTANMPKDWADMVGNLSNPAYYLPYGRAAKPIVETTEKALKYVNSPLTGEWVRFGNMEYRLSPNTMSANLPKFESRPVLTEGMKKAGWTISEDGAYISSKGQRFVRNAKGELQDEASFLRNKNSEKTPLSSQQYDSHVDLNNYHGEPLTGNEPGFDKFALRQRPENDHFPNLSHGLDNPSDIHSIITREFEGLPNGARVDLGDTFSGDTSPLLLQYAFRYQNRIKPVLPRNPEAMVKTNPYGIRGTEMVKKFNEQLERLLDAHGYSPTAIPQAIFNESDNTLSVPALSLIKLHKNGGNL